ncbi:MAG: ABC transporter permease [Candidatus Cloacimonetes bacterium]|nr:ABC transporter permease [Candidatus Cloacimonadota bacterium]MCA9787118.1 ABC transporter permease [Candidatus Cloacimonadota bacterium]
MPDRGALLEALRISIASLLSHKLRSLLTMLGVIFGVGAVISMLSIGEGARREALENIRLLGARNILVMAVPRDRVPSEDLEKGSPGLGPRDVISLQGLLPNATISAVVNSDAQAGVGRRRVKVPLRGVEPEYLAQFPGMEINGRWLTDADEHGRTRVCVLGSQVARELFPTNSPLERLVKLDDQWMRVVGVVQPRALSEKGKQELSLRDLNRDIYIPLSTLRSRMPPVSGKEGLDQLVITVATTEEAAPASERVRRVLERRHMGARDTEIQVPWELIRQSQATQRMFNLVMGAIASISLIVGGIGIMNIMLSSVLERTREIGIRRSVGATAAHVMQQFITEAVVLSLGGGLLGIVLGLCLAWGISAFAGWHTVVTPWSVLLSFAVSAGTGLIFGIYPARRAAALDPIEALRHE